MSIVHFWPAFCHAANKRRLMIDSRHPKDMPFVSVFLGLGRYKRTKKNFGDRSRQRFAES